MSPHAPGDPSKCTGFRATPAACLLSSEVLCLALISALPASRGTPSGFSAACWLWVLGTVALSLPALCSHGQVQSRLRLETVLQVPRRATSLLGAPTAWPILAPECAIHGMSLASQSLSCLKHVPLCGQTFLPALYCRLCSPPGSCLQTPGVRGWRALSSEVSLELSWWA